MESPPRQEREVKPTNSEAVESIAGEVDKATILDWVENNIEPNVTKLELLETMTYQEDIPAWSQAISSYLKVNIACKFSFLEVQQALKMDCVEVWLGALHLQRPYQLQQCGEFYEPNSIHFGILP